MVSRRVACLVALALCVSGAAGGVSDARKDLPPAPSVVRLSVLAGRATLVQAEELRTLTKATGARAVHGEAFLEVGAKAEVEISWPGAASLGVRGPASLEWDKERGVRVLSAEVLEAEVRRGTLALELPRGWRTELARTALSLAELAGGELVFANRGAAPIALWPAKGPPKTLAGGAEWRVPGPR
jgi:hypothetical protein